MLHRRSCLVGLLVLSVGSAALATEIPIGGRIVTMGGKALADVEVVLLALPDSLTEVGGVLEGSPAEPVARALSDKQGRFELAAPHAGLWRVRIEAPGFVPLQSELGPLIEPLELPDAELSVDEGISLRVTDRQGQPITGALVLARSDLPRFAFTGAEWAPPMRSGRTDENGVLELPRSADERITISAAAPGFVPSEKRGIRGTAAGLRLDRGPRRSVEVVSAAGQPLADVLLFVGPRPHPVGRTDEAGRGVATINPSAPVTLRLLAADGRRLETQLRPASSTPERPRRLSLPDRLLISGRLIDADTRRPISGGLVWDGSDPDEASASDRAGGFVLGGPAGHRLDVSAGAPGYLLADPLAFQLNDDGRPGPTLALQPAAAVAGTVVDGDGEPVPGAELELAVRRNPSMMRIEIGGTRSLARSRSGPSGKFRISPIDPEQSYELRVRAEGYAPASEVLTGLEPYRTRAGVRIELTRGQSLTGTVVDTDGNPLRDAAVRLAAAAPRRGLHGMRLMQPGAGASRFSADSDDAGRFTVTGVPAGKFDLTVSRRGFAQRTVPAVELVTGDDVTDIGEVVLEPGEKIHGVVLDRDRQPVEGAEIELLEAGPMLMMALPGGPGSGETEPDAVTDPAGWFALEDLGRDEKYNFTVRRTGFVEARVSGIQLPHVEPLEVTMQPASKVAGRVLDSQGEPVAGAQVEMSRSRKMEMGGTAIAVMMMTGETADDEGRFVFEDQEPGVLSLRALSSGYQEATLDNIEVPVGKDVVGLELTLPPGAILQGRILAPDGRGAIQATIRLAGEGNEMMRIDGTFSDGAGYYRLEGLAPRTVSVEAIHPDYPRTVKDVELDEGLNALDLQFEGGHEVAGRVSDTAGGTVADALVRLVPTGRSWGGPEARTRADGSFALPGVQDGDYRVWVEAHGYAPTSGEQQVVVAGEPVAGLELVLDTGAAIRGTISGLESRSGATAAAA